MKNTALTRTAFVAASVFSVGVLAGCDYCQPLLLATAITLVIERWLPASHRGTHYENFAS
jgi:hypothetical protein